MLRLLNVAAIIFVCCTGIAHAEQNLFAIGGTPTNANAWPTVVSLHGPSPSYEFKCTGTLISDSWVLTARHCVQKNLEIDGATISQNDIVVFQGTDELKNLVNPLPVFKIVPCERNNGCPGAAGNPLKDGDLALLRLQDPINSPIVFIPLQQPTETQYSQPGQPGLNIASMGWGRMTPTGPPCKNVPELNRKFNQVDLELLDDQQCNEAIVNAVIKSKMDYIACDLAIIDMKFKNVFLNDFGLKQSQVNEIHANMTFKFDQFAGSDEFLKLIKSMEGKSLLEAVFDQIHGQNPNLRYMRPKNTVCAAKMGKTSCHGDSGGPLVATIGNEKRQIGVVGGGAFDQCADPNYPHVVPGFYQHVGHFHKWITGQMKKQP